MYGGAETRGDNAAPGGASAAEVVREKRSFWSRSLRWDLVWAVLQSFCFMTEYETEYDHQSTRRRTASVSGRVQHEQAIGQRRRREPEAVERRSRVEQSRSAYRGE